MTNWNCRVIVTAGGVIIYRTGARGHSTETRKRKELMVPPLCFYFNRNIILFKPCFTCFSSVQKAIWNYSSKKLYTCDKDTSKALAKLCIKDVRAHCYCASLVRTLFIGHARARSFLSMRTESKTQQNTELITFAFTLCVNIFVGCSVTPIFFRQIASFSDSFHYTRKQKKSVRGKF